MDSEEYVLLEGVLVDLYVKADPSAIDKIVTGSDGKRRLYTRMNKALYGHMRSGRLFFEHISATLRDLGFKHNPDELCIWNKDINGKQMTVVLYVEYLKVSFCDKKGLEFMRDLAVVYGDLDPKEGPVFDYCGITLDYGVKGVCKLSTPKYIDTAILDFEKMNGGKVRRRAKTPAQANLFNVRDNVTALEEGKRKVFHSVFAHLLRVDVKTRPDILVALSFLGKRTSKADLNDWDKLERLLSYLQDTRNMPLSLGIE